MRARAVVLAVAIVLAPLGARAADLVVWWEKGYYAQEDEAVREIVAAFEQKTGKQVELDLPFARGQLPDKIVAALEAGQPPDFAFGIQLPTTTTANGPSRIGWSISRTRSGPSRTCSIRTRSTGPRCSTRRPGRRALYGLPIGLVDQPCPRLEEPAGAGRASRSTTSPRSGRRSGRSGATRCSRRCARPRGRDDIWGVGLAMSVEAGDTSDRVLPVRAGLRGGLRDPRRPAGHRRPGDQAQARSRRSTAIRPSTARAAPRPIR